MRSGAGRKGRREPGFLPARVRARLVTSMLLAAFGLLGSAFAHAASRDGFGTLPCPDRFPVEIGAFSQAEIDAAKTGVFSVAGVPTRLEPPINWHRDRLGSRTYRRSLNGLAWLDPLYYAYLSGGDLEALNDAKRIVRDFARQNPRPDPHFRAAWERKRASDRLVRIAFTVRAASCEGALRRRSARLLLRAARRHARFLLRERGAPERSNHDLVGDLGLMAAGRYLPFLHRAGHWYRVGKRRFEGAFAVLVDRRTGVHLEHTASYQALTVTRLSSYLGLAREPAPGMSPLLDRMKEVSSWFVMPDETFVPLGDTPFTERAPEYAVGDSGADHGLAPTRRSGFAFVKEPGSYLAVAAGYHRPAHKHADELTFDLFESGRRVIVGSGRYNPGRGPRGGLSFSYSSQAESTLTVDGRSFPLRGNYYGSAVDAQGSGDGWYAIEGHNPLLRHQGVRHRRLFLYRPDVALVIVDRLRSTDRHAYSRFVQIAPGVDAERDGAVTGLTGGGFEGTVWSRPTPRDRAARLLLGERNPLRGWYATPGISRLLPRYTLELRSRARSITHLTTIGIGADPVTAKATPDGAIVDLPGGAIRVSLSRSGHRLQVDASPGG